jgi:hypothetical protein
MKSESRNLCDLGESPSSISRNVSSLLCIRLPARVVKTLHPVRYQASEAQGSPYRSRSTLSAAESSANGLRDTSSGADP